MNKKEEMFEKFSSDELNSLQGVKGGRAGITADLGNKKWTIGKDPDGCECDDDEADPVD